MDKRTKRLTYLYLACQLLLPLCLGIGYLWGRPFVGTKFLLPGVVAGISVYITYKLQDAKDSGWLAALFLPTFCNGLCLLTQGIFGGIAAIICWVCGWAMVKKGRRGFLRGLCYVTSVLLTVVFLLFLPIWGFVQVMRCDRVVEVLHSPALSYTAKVISSDQGALGGATWVEVQDNKRTVNLLLGSFQSKFQLWSAGYGAHERMTLQWEDAETLQINGISYTVSGENAARIGEISRTLGTEIKAGKVLTHWDTHGGFHGDGTTFTKIQGSCKIPDSPFWHPLPAPEEARRLMSLTGESLIPEVKKGYWFFYDRHSGSEDPARIVSRGSWNFTLAVYDPKENILYYYELDT